MVDGPLAMDNAIDMDAARTKGIASLVAGHANVLIAPNIESGNMLAKELTFVAHAEAAGLVVGASAPVMLTSRADNDKARLVSCALAQLYKYWRDNGKPSRASRRRQALAANARSATRGGASAIEDKHGRHHPDHQRRLVLDQVLGLTKSPRASSRRSRSA